MLAEAEWIVRKAVTNKAVRASKSEQTEFEDRIGFK